MGVAREKAREGKVREGYPEGLMLEDESMRGIIAAFLVIQWQETRGGRK